MELGRRIECLSDAVSEEERGWKWIAWMGLEGCGHYGMDSYSYGTFKSTGWNWLANNLNYSFH